jgi:ferrochelatase
LGLTNDQWRVSFQSRLGRLPWLQPYTDQLLRTLPNQGITRLTVVCPAFVADNLETLEEIGMTGREHFLAAGGESLTLVPCLNDDRIWVDTVAGWCRADYQTLTAHG